MKWAQCMAWGWCVGLSCVLASSDPEVMLVRGRGVEIRRRDLDALFERSKTELTHQGQVLSEAQTRALRAQLLERLVLFRLCEVRARESDRKRARTDSRVFIEGLKRDRGEEGFGRLLRMAGYTLPAFEADKFSEALVAAVMDREVKATIRIPSADIQEYYDRNTERWVEPAAVRFLHLQILLRGADGLEPTVEERLQCRRRIDELKAQLDRGADFAALAREHSEDATTRARGGEYRAVRGELPFELETEVFRLEPGATSGVIGSPQGWHLVRILERIPPKRIPLERVEEEIREVLVQRELPLRIPEFLDRVRREVGLEMVLPAGEEP